MQFTSKELEILYELVEGRQQECKKSAQLRRNEDYYLEQLRVKMLGIIRKQKAIEELA